MLIGTVNIYIFIFLSLFVMIHFRGTCSCNEMLKGYMAVESLGILVLNLNLGLGRTVKWREQHQKTFVVRL